MASKCRPAPIAPSIDNSALSTSNPNAGSATPVPSIGNYTTINTIPPFGFVGVWTDTRTGVQTIFSGN